MCLLSFSPTLFILRVPPGSCQGWTPAPRPRTQKAWSPCKGTEQGLRKSESDLMWWVGESAPAEAGEGGWGQILRNVADSRGRIPSWFWGKRTGNSKVRKGTQFHFQLILLLCGEQVGRKWEWTQLGGHFNSSGGWCRRPGPRCWRCRWGDVCRAFPRGE